MLHAKWAPVAVALALAVPAVQAHAQATLKIATWAGAYAEAQKIAVFDPFSKDTGTRIDASLQAGAAGVSGADWDVADLSSADASAYAAASAYADDPAPPGGVMEDQCTGMPLARITR